MNTQQQAVFRHLEACHNAHSNENVCVCSSSWDRWVHICCWHLQLDELVACVCVCAGCLEHWAVPTQIPFTFDLIRVPSISEFMCVCVCVVVLPAVCFSHLHNREKNTTAFFFLQSYGPFFQPVFPWRVLVLCVCVYPVCVCVSMHFASLPWMEMHQNIQPTLFHTHRHMRQD